MRFLPSALALFACSVVFGGEPAPACTGPGCGVSVQVTPTCYGPGCGFSMQTPPVIYQPRTVYQPYQYQGSTVAQIQYPTPIRNWWFGRYRTWHYYRPMR